MIRIYHTADLHIGLRFKNHPEASETLAQARYDTLEKLVDMANDKKTEIFAIAGDLFDRTSMKVSDIQKAVQAVNKFEQNDAIKLYAKLPAWFTITTPLGPYNPDWAVLYDRDGEEKLYFVVETKGSLFSGDLREKEQGKIECGREHFKALDSGVIYEPVNNFDSFLDVVDDTK